MESFIRTQKLQEVNSIVFQILSWEAFDEEVENLNDENEGEPDNKYHIYTFGVNECGESVCVRFEGYKPYLFAYIPDKLQKSFDNFKKIEVEKYIRNKLFRNKGDLESVSIVLRKKYMGFTNEKDFKFLRFVCKNLTTFNKIKIS